MIQCWSLGRGAFAETVAPRSKPFIRLFALAPSATACTAGPSPTLEQPRFWGHSLFGDRCSSERCWKSAGAYRPFSNLCEHGALNRRGAVCVVPLRHRGDWGHGARAHPQHCAPPGHMRRRRSRRRRRQRQGRGAAGAGRGGLPRSGGPRVVALLARFRRRRRGHHLPAQLPACRDLARAAAHGQARRFMREAALHDGRRLPRGRGDAPSPKVAETLHGRHGVPLDAANRQAHRDGGLRVARVDEDGHRARAPLPVSAKGRALEQV
mmetsp:Transcript_18038/g.64136  ORF Transcript_18038/g.64136 Transcript_18038/m.64136 type:complete len:266 (+) Transcript_18038:3-800(+)